jgi:alkylation response protein AidB-like acyl-CoA dehydrogenase
MLGFTLTPELQAEKDRAHTFAEKIMRPVARKYDETGEWAVDVYKEAFNFGYLQALVPEDCANRLTAWVAPLGRWCATSSCPTPKRA